MKLYKNYEITTGGLGYLYVHKDYDGVYEYDGETGEPSEYDERSGSAYTLQQAMEEIDEIEERRRERQEERDLRNNNRLPDFEINYER